MVKAHPKKVSDTGTGTQVALARPCVFWGFMVGTAAADPTITVYDNASAASGMEIVPTTTYDASALGLNGAMLGAGVWCDYGITVDVTCAGAWEVTVYYS